MTELPLLRLYPLTFQERDGDVTEDIKIFRRYPAGTWRRNDVGRTSMRRDDVVSTSVRRHFVAMCPLGMA